MIGRLAQEVLRVGLDDWVPLAAIDGLARQLGASNDAESVQLGLAAIRELVEQGLAVIGQVSDRGFVDWTEPLDDALARIERAWRTLNSIEWGFACWLKNTPAGGARVTDR
jgi:hypothetical protein